jgi:hypothetical protein
VTLLRDGIYLNLPNRIYQANPALGGGDHRSLLLNAVQWHGRERNPTWRALNPPSEEETAAQRFGTALHCMVLEPEHFEDRYYVEPPRPYLPRTKDEINAELAAMGRQTLSTSKKSVEFEAAARLAGIMLKSDWDDEHAIIANGRESISERWQVALQTLDRVIQRHSKAQRFISNGRAEVSIIYTDEHGVRLKCRFDYLRVRTVCDVKTYAQRSGAGAIEGFCSARDAFAYDLAAAHYMDLRINALPALVAAGHVFDARKGDDGIWNVIADKADLDFMGQVAEFREPRWWWLACSTMGVPEVDTINFPMSLLAFSSAQTQVEMARAKYREMRGIFGEDDNEMWMEDRGLVALTDQNFSQRSINRGAAMYETVEG